MELYYSPGTCALAPHIVALELGLPITLTQIDLATRRTAAGRDFNAVNPKGYVPALRLASGEVLTEVAAVLQYLVDQVPAAGLAPPQGTLERYRFIEWLTFISSEIHKGFGPLWSAAAPKETRTAAVEKLGQRFAYLDRHLAYHPYLMSERFSAADAYLFTVMRWADYHQVDLTPFPHLQRYLVHVSARPAVQKALVEEGLLKQAA